MIDYSNKGKTATSKNGNTAVIIDEYNRLTDGARMITARSHKTGKVVYLIAKNCTIA
jgi:hypothetical protein